MEGTSSTDYCCMAPSDKCTKDEKNEIEFVNCTNGQVLPLSEPCQETCYNDYKTSQYYGWFYGHYSCKPGQKCLPIEDMCHGQTHPGCGDLHECNSHLKCAQYPDT